MYINLHNALFVLRIASACGIFVGLHTYGQQYEYVLSVLHDLGIKTKQSHQQTYTVHCVQPFSEDNRNHYDARSPTSSINFLIMHYTHCDLQQAMKTFTSNQKHGRVSAHYVITSGGIVIRVVPEEQRAWHAGDSRWGTTHDLNDESIGIEIINTGFTKTASGRRWYPFDEQQIAAVGKLSRDIIQRHNIPAHHVLGHADIAPQRKHDPGIVFPWARLYYEYNVGAWLENTDPAYIRAQYQPTTYLPPECDTQFMLSQLQQYGYPIQHPRHINNNEMSIRAFKAHFSENQDTSEYNSSITWNDIVWIWGLVAKYTNPHNT